MEKHERSPIPIAIQRSPEHSLKGHPENPGRYTRFSQLFQSSVAEHLQKIEFHAVDEGLIRSVHTPLYLESLQLVEPGQVRLLDFGDTYLTSESYRCAKLAAGAIVGVAEAVIHSDARCGFALARPPGHHATSSEGMGFCLLNNAAIAARYLQRRGLRRLLIVDFDVHHGNGTQDIFYQDGEVHYVSTHQRGIYPGTGALGETGDGAGVGTTLNVALPAFTGNDGMLRIFQEIVAPFAERARPDALLVSAGYDAHRDDPLANLQLTEYGYHQITAELLRMAEKTTSGKAIFILEGGYNLNALYGSVLATLQGMVGQFIAESAPDRAARKEPDLSELIERVQAVHEL